MNSFNYESALRYCVKIVSKFCLNKDLPPNILTGTISTVRIHLDTMLTTHPYDLPYPINKKIDEILQYELSIKYIILSDHLPRLRICDQISLFKGDIATINADCIVNNANSSGIGCFILGHKCIDHHIHSKAGPRLRAECNEKMKLVESQMIKPGNLIVTLGYNLPSKYVFHAVGPIYDSNRTNHHEEILARTYIQCLNQMKEMGLRSIVFCCIAVEEYSYPKHLASDTAIQVVKHWLKDNEYPIHIIFCVSTDHDISIYETSISTYL